MENVPALHGVQVVAASAPTTLEWVPMGHGRQEVLLDAPNVLEYVPALHDEQHWADAAHPSTAEKVPA